MNPHSKIELPFTVSARTAMLIGRENIANAKGAIIELVKNSCDADSKFCLIFVDNEFSYIREHLTANQIEKLISSGITPLYFKNLYDKDLAGYSIKANPRKMYLRAFEKRTRILSKIYIIDAGDGMTEEVIRSHWMTIGTDNKLLSNKTENGRIKSGAKGIGRFALDKLGAECKMTTIYKNSTDKGASVWSVNWKDFEGPKKTINEVTASLEMVPCASLNEAILKTSDLLKIDDLGIWLQKLTRQERYKNLLSDVKNGTVLKISNLNDDWTPGLVGQIYEDLEVLIPPRDVQDFNIYLLSSAEPQKYGEILGPECSDYDYKVEATANNNQEVSITIFREEYETEKIPAEFFDRPRVINGGLNQFPKKSWTKTYSYSELLPGFKDDQGVFDQIGPFGFNFYFLKRSTSSDDVRRFYYKDFSASTRKSWLQQFSGVKIYRDNFRVRPYGEAKDAAFDWLGLGLRQSASPAGVAKSNGGFRVRPENIAGSINISRLTNIKFEDKSSRDGLQDSLAFSVFSNLLKGIISKFEVDRALISRELDEFYKTFHRGSSNAVNEAEKAEAEKIIKAARIAREKLPKALAISETANEDAKKIDLLTRFAEQKADENKRLLEEQKILRAMASSGIVAASFGHDLSKTRDSLDVRFDELIELLSPKVSINDFASTEDYLNPYMHIQSMRKADRNISTWLGFALGFTRKDKRKRGYVYLSKFLDDLKVNWDESLADRGISLHITCPDDLKLRMYEIDFDSIFLNLIVNSIEAFKNSRLPNIREIFLNCVKTDSGVEITYVDTGPGLPDNLDDPNIIFAPLYTTRRDSVGQEIGTGLGMWIIKTIADEYQMKLDLVVNKPKEGFCIKFLIPHKYIDEE